MNKLKFKIVTPERLLEEGEADSITLPTVTGQITVLPHHIPLVSVLTAGEVIIQLAQGEIYVAVEGGFIEVMPDGVVILADAADRGDELDESVAAAAVQRAEEALAQAVNKPDADYAALRAQLNRELSRLRVARRYKQRGVRTHTNNN